MHVTIRFLGEVEPAEVERLQELLAPPIAVAPFEIAWRGIGTFPNNRHPRALWLGVINGAAQLARDRSRDLAARRRRTPSSSTTAPLLPHLTLGRVKMAGAGVDWPKILQAVEVQRRHVATSTA